MPATRHGGEDAEIHKEKGIRTGVLPALNIAPRLLKDYISYGADDCLTTYTAKWTHGA